MLESIGGFILAAGLLLIVVNLVRQLLPRRGRRQRPVARGHARMVDDLAAAALQLPGHPDRHESLRDV